MIVVLLIFGCAILGVVAYGLKTGTIFRFSKVQSGRSQFVSRRDDPGSFWLAVAIGSVCGLFPVCVAVWILIYGL